MCLCIANHRRFGFSTGAFGFWFVLVYIATYAVIRENICLLCPPTGAFGLSFVIGSVCIWFFFGQTPVLLPALAFGWGFNLERHDGLAHP
jgi:hypothetical protein